MHKNTIKRRDLLIGLGILVVLTGFLAVEHVTCVLDNTPKTVISLQTQTSEQIGTHTKYTSPNTLQTADTEGEEADSSDAADQTVPTWSTVTQVDIFQVSYENGEGQVTAVGLNGDKIVAPGTSSSYQFVIRNEDDSALEYTLWAEAYFGDSVYSIPVEVRLSAQDGTYLLGSETAWAPFTDLDRLTHQGTLSGNHYTYYLLEWQWPFEGDDEYDTLLGNLAVEKDLTLTVVLRTTAVSSTSATATGGLPNSAESIGDVLTSIWNGTPQTGDSFQLVLWLSLAGASLVILLLVLFLPQKKKEEDKPHEEG